MMMMSCMRVKSVSIEVFFSILYRFFLQSFENILSDQKVLQ